ncbi:class I SAM-dependent methyltransferase [Mucilaginibacter arboris]|uniref:Methyltransferase domain-containing protein n=1 Tax=Mucilaginibacter arboris TaxID=2682090 RepID=A0A7K1T045_9SPHI|nr:class I SAM-dependent methyltransferase [Mucilaginibacter arboris]MVN22936.1 methyltransferase domain-containing protein [Mucilaginibacter arboris]
MPNNYDAAAWFYDSLAELVFGKALVNAQRFLVKHIKPKTNILIVGGGTGWILEEIANLQPSTLKITYVEISVKMLALSKKRNCGLNEVNFVNQGIEDYKITQKFDVILTPFLFDNFSEKRIQNVFDQLHPSLKIGGLWLICDFQVEDNYKSIWQKIVLQTMYWFFGWLCEVETNQLIKMNSYFKDKDYILLEEKTFYRGFIISKVYQQSNDF